MTIATELGTIHEWCVAALASLSLQDDGIVRLDYRPVHLQPLSNEVSSIPPKERVY